MSHQLTADRLEDLVLRRVQSAGLDQLPEAQLAVVRADIEAEVRSQAETFLPDDDEVSSKA